MATTPQTEASPNFEPNTTSERALSAVETAGPRAEELVAVWLKHSNAEAICEVAERGTGAARKAARRAVNILRARGVKLPERKRVGRIAKAAETETLDAWMVPPDAGQNMVLVVARRSVTSRYFAAFVFMNDALGVQRVDVGEVSQSQLRESLHRLQNGDHKPARVPFDWARARIFAARKKNQERNQPEPLGLHTAKQLLGDPPSEMPPHPFDAEGLELSLEDSREMAKGSAALHNLPEFRTWLPPRPAVDDLLRNVGEGLVQGQEPDPTELQERLEEAIKQATDRFFGPEQREQLARTMKDSALSVLQREGEVAALQVVATINALQNAGLITDPPHEIPFLRGFFDKAVGVLLAQGGGRLRIPVRNAAGSADPVDPSTQGSEGEGQDAASSDDSVPPEQA